MLKNEIVTGICDNYTHDGQGVVKVDHYPIFVKGLMVGEEAKIQIMKDKKKYAFGRIVEITKPSAHRITPPCPAFKRCGGCQLQYMDSEAQREFKQTKVQEVISRIAKLDTQVNPVIGMDHPFDYRNKGQIPVQVSNHQVTMGFFRIHSNDIVDIDHCFIQSEVINKLMNCIKLDLKQYQNGKNLRHVLIKHGFHTGEAMVVLISKVKEIPHLDDMIAHMKETYPLLKSVIININTRQDNVILGNKEFIMYGDGYIMDELHGLKFHISSKSFYQVNPIQTKILYELALQYAELTGNEEVLDLYCGVGTISLFMAASAKHVTGIEIVPAAIEDAKRNAQLNNIHNIDFVCRDAAEYANQLVEQKQTLDVIIVDPPRKGCDEETLHAMVEMNPKRIVYVSCDPATLARDLRILEDNDYHVEMIQPVDMFPQTYHIESVIRLSRTK